MRIIFVGRLIEAKGVQDLVKATDGLDCSVVIVGDGYYRPNLEAMKNGHCTFTGELDRAGVFCQLQASDIFVNPSYSEGLPTSVLEAASVGLAIIATDVGGTREIIEHTRTGLLYQAGDIDMLRVNLSVFLSHPGLARAMGRLAQESVKVRFNWDTIAKQYCELLEEVGKKR